MIMKNSLFDISKNMWVEAFIDGRWVLSRITDIAPDGKRVWISNHNGRYDVDRATALRQYKRINNSGNKIPKYALT